jgi:hypothetical protein
VPSERGDEVLGGLAAIGAERLEHPGRGRAQLGRGVGELGEGAVVGAARNSRSGKGELAIWRSLEEISYPEHASWNHMSEC